MMICRPQVRLAVSERNLVNRVRRALESADLQFEVFVDEDCQEGAQSNGARAPVSRNGNENLVPLHLIDAVPDVTPALDDPEPHLRAVYLQAPPLQDVLERGLRYPLLLRAEPGSGVHEFVHTLHARGPRAGRPLAVFSPGDASLQAAMREADGGTLLVHNVEALTRAEQVLLASVAREGGRAHGPDLDIVCVTHARCEIVKGSLEPTGLLGQFRDRLEVAPLRARTRELHDLLDKVVEHFRADLNRPEIRGFDADATGLLEAYSWPGNIAELIHVVEQAMVATDGNEIRPEHLPAELRARVEAHDHAPAPHDDLLPPGWETMSLREVREAATARTERMFLERLLQRTAGRIGKTADLAGISPRALYDRMRKHDLRKEDYKPSRRR